MPKAEMNKRIALVIAGVAIVGLAAVIAWTQLRGGGGTDEKVRDVRAGVRLAVISSLTETLDVSEDEFKRLFGEKQLLERAEEIGLTRQEVLAASQEAAEAYLDEQVAAGEISQDEAEDAAARLLETLGEHL